MFYYDARFDCDYRHSQFGHVSSKILHNQANISRSRVKRTETNLNQHDMSQNKRNQMFNVSDDINCLTIVSCVFSI